MISGWKQELVTRAGELFARSNKAPAVGDAQKVIDELHRKIGQLQVERDFLAGQPAISRLLRGGRWPAGGEKLELLKRLDRIFTAHPVYGSRRLQVALLREGISVGRRRVRRLMKKLGLWAVRPKRNTSKRHPEHKGYPYLLRGKTIDQPNQVWAADVTYIPMQQGFLYLVAIIDWATRRVLSWRLSNTLTAGFCVEALSEALARFGKPGIFNTDQGA